MLGNRFTLPCARWSGQRIAEARPQQQRLARRLREIGWQQADNVGSRKGAVYIGFFMKYTRAVVRAERLLGRVDQIATAYQFVRRASVRWTRSSHIADFANEKVKVRSRRQLPFRAHHRQIGQCKTKKYAFIVLTFINNLILSAAISGPSTFGDQCLR